jgi:hypothetical protein
MLSAVPPTPYYERLLDPATLRSFTDFPLDPDGEARAAGIIDQRVDAPHPGLDRRYLRRFLHCKPRSSDAR